jgi:hypothetical protein
MILRAMLVTTIAVKAFALGTALGAGAALGACCALRKLRGETRRPTAEAAAAGDG